MQQQNNAACTATTALRHHNDALRTAARRAANLPFLNFLRIDVTPELPDLGPMNT